jgi:tRNA(Ile)-lysidine synthase
MVTDKFWLPLEHGLYRWIQPYLGKSFLLAVSGGIDSMSLLAAFVRLKIQPFSVIYLHHGDSPSLEQCNYRIQAQHLVESFCLENQIPCQSYKSGEVLNSEQEMRSFRQRILSEQISLGSQDYVVYAHHRDDLIETQILNLIRGSGFHKPFMDFEHLQELRPFLNFSKQQIKSYSEEIKVPFLEDPSNQQSEYLRNWLRNSWLPQLEEKCPGALNSLSRSLTLLQEKDRSLPEGLFSGESEISRPLFLSLDRIAQKRALAVFGQRLGLKNFTQNHIFEVLKHLDKAQSEHSFICAKMNWSCEEASIRAQPLS